MGGAMGDELDYAALAANTEANAVSGGSLHLPALWREMAENYCELSDCRRRKEEVAPSGQACDL
jgi:hypothetical protein